MMAASQQTTVSLDAWLCSKSRNQQFTIVPFVADSADPNAAALFAALNDDYVTEWKQSTSPFTTYETQSAMLAALRQASTVLVVDAASNEVVGGIAVLGTTIDFFVISAFRAEGQTIAILQMASLWLATHGSALVGTKPLHWLVESGDLPMLRLLQKIDRTCGDANAFSMTPVLSDELVDTTISNPAALVVRLAAAVTTDSKKRRVVRMHPGRTGSQHPSPFDSLIEAAKADWAPKRSKSSSDVTSDSSSKQGSFYGAASTSRHNPYAISVVPSVVIRTGDPVWVSNCSSSWEAATWQWATTECIILDQLGPYCYLSTPLDLPFQHLAVTRLA